MDGSKPSGNHVERVAGKYRVERLLGTGGMARVVAAIHEQLGERVAIKFLLPNSLQYEETLKRFVREARAAARLKSEHVARVLDVGTTEDNTPYIVMEYLEGSDLAALVRTHGPMDVAVAIDYILQACVALAEAHALGVVHRDIKPANLFLTERPDGSPLIKVLDFGIATAAPDFGDSSLTTSQATMGSPFYMSPEQLRSSRDVDERTDIWGLGVVLFELVTGRRAFPAKTLPEVCIQVITGPTPHLSLANLPPGFEAVVHRCLRKDPGERYANVSEFAEALVKFARPEVHNQAARVARVLQRSPHDRRSRSSQPNKARLSVAGSSPQRGDLTRVRGSKRLVIAGVLLAALAALGIGIGLHSRRAPAPTDSAARSNSGEALDKVPPRPAPPARRVPPTPGGIPEQTAFPQSPGQRPDKAETVGEQAEKPQESGKPKQLSTRKRRTRAQKAGEKTPIRKKKVDIYDQWEDEL